MSNYVLRLGCSTCEWYHDEPLPDMPNATDAQQFAQLQAVEAQAMTFAASNHQCPFPQFESEVV